jgi:hypothetical protein
MAEIFSDPRQKEHIANLGKPIEKPKASPLPTLKQDEEVVDVVATPVKPKIVATGGKK